MKDYHLGDMATQLWVMRQAGVQIASAAIRHIDTSFELQEPETYDGLLKDTFVGDEVAAASSERGVVVDAAREMLNGAEPSIEMGTQCSKPFECEFQSYCLKQSDAVVTEWPISLLPRTGKRIAASYAKLGIYDLKDVPAGELTHKNHEKIRLATVNDQPFHDVSAIVKETDEWAFPLIHLDFETCNLAIPRWVGTRPYQQVPFQFSAHIEAKDGSVDHREFLDLSGNDPRLGCAAALAELPASGSVVTWNASFERNCLKALAEFSPEHADALLSLANRVVDLKVIAEKHYYHRDQRGSWSIKNVLPTLASELDYGTLEVKAGGDAIEAFNEAVAEGTSSDRREAISEALLAYCERDTWAMVVLLRALRNQ